VTENAIKFKEFSDYMVADAYFSKKLFVECNTIIGFALHQSPER
jgi:hypothetical protein